MAVALAQGVGPVAAKPLPGSSPRPAVSTLSTSPLDTAGEVEGGSAELFVTLKPGDGLDDLLVRAGVAGDDAARASALVADALPSGVPAGSDVALLLGKTGGHGQNRLQRLTVRSALELKLIVERQVDGQMRLLREDISVDSSPLRFAGQVGSGLYWSLRERGVPAEAASQYLALVSAKVDIARELGPDDRFDLVLAHRRASTGESRIGPLLYAAVDRRDGRDVQLVSWASDGRARWIDANGGEVRDSAWVRPVQGRVSSPFGTRLHPILRFARFHRGIDLSAPWGTPIVAAADGRVVGAGWNGGHGRQVRIAHQGALESSYSHMSEIAVPTGASVRRGQVIGYVGSSGFSTGPHLHYEVHHRGRPLDPLNTHRFDSVALSPAEMEAVRARVRQLLAIDA